MLTLVPTVYRDLIEQADERGISIQELLRAVIVPHWLGPPSASSTSSKRGVMRPTPGHIEDRRPKD